MICMTRCDICRKATGPPISFRISIAHMMSVVQIARRTCWYRMSSQRPDSYHPWQLTFTAAAAAAAAGGGGSWLT